VIEGLRQKKNGGKLFRKNGVSRGSAGLKIERRSQRRWRSQGGRSFGSDIAEEKCDFLRSYKAQREGKSRRKRKTNPFCPPEVVCKIERECKNL